MLNRVVPWLENQRPVAQLDALARAFLARFFESEITSGTDDLKSSFFWLLSTLAIPGIFVPWLMVFDWHMVAIFQGPEVLREVSRSEKMFYVGFSMIASGILTTIAWSSLLPDRRDALVLGSLPVRPRIIVSARLLALAAYVAIVAVYIHTLAAVSFGMILSQNSPFVFLVRGILAHFVASLAASMFVVFAVTGVQGLALAISGPRLFERLSTILQVGLVALIALCLAYLPTLTSSIVPTLRGTADAQSWLMLTPPSWFLGLYETVLGTSDPVLRELASTAVLALAIAVAGTLLTYPLAYRRVMVAVVETNAGPSRGAVARRLRDVLIAAAGRRAGARAAADFFTATLGRVERQRFVLSIALGLALAWGLPGWTAYEPSPLPAPGVLSLPIVAMLFLLAGLRVASALPGDVRAGWLFEVHDVSRRDARQALERTMFLLGVLPPALLSAPAYWLLWGRHVALVHALVMVALGIATIQLLIWHSQGIPCGQRLSPRRLDFGRRWPLHFAMFLFVAVGIPRLEAVLFNRPIVAAIFVTDLMIVAAAVRHVSARHQIVPMFDDVDPVAGVLRLN